MVGSFGYEEEHFVFSQQIGELVLFPAVLFSSIRSSMARYLFTHPSRAKIEELRPLPREHMSQS
jgi:hypothetical protein